MDPPFQDVLFQPGPIVWVQEFFGCGDTIPFRLIDLLASTWGVLLVVSLGLWLWGRDDTYALAGIVFLEVLVNLVLNQILSVPRPAGPEIVKYEQVGLGSFPSGHVFTAAVLWGLLWARGRVPLWLAALVVLEVALGRLYLGVHYLADVVAGATLGVLLVWLFRRVWPPIHAWLGARSGALLVGAGLLGVAAATAGLLLTGTRNHFVYKAVGLAAGGGLALLIEREAVRFTPAEPTPARALGKLGIGLLGVAPLIAIDQAAGESALWLGAGLAFAGAVWALLVAPALFQRLGWGERTSAPTRAAAAAEPE